MEADMSKKPNMIDTTVLEHRVRCLSAYHSILSEGGDEHQAKLGAVARALTDWNKWDYRHGTLVAAKGSDPDV